MERLYRELSALAREPVLWIALAFTSAYLIAEWDERVKRRERRQRGFEVLRERDA
jgi:hypothetical protein